MNLWLTQHFVNPSFVLPVGAALIAIPIIIHLINRLKYRRVRFAAMEFLLASEERNRRRLMIEQLLLLLLRILIVACIVLLLGRLVLDASEMSLFRGATAHHVVLLDDSGSMRDQLEEGTAFETGLQVVKRLVAEGARRPSSQRFTLILLSRPDQPLFTQRSVDEAFLNELETRLENVDCSHQAGDFTKGLDAVERLFAEERTLVRQLHLVSDFRESDWAGNRAASQQLGNLEAEGVGVNLVRAVPERHSNLAVTKLVGDLNVAAAGVPVRLTTTIANHSDQAARDVRASIFVDGEKLPMSLPFETIEAGAEIESDFDITFKTATRHTVRVALEPDALNADNSAYLAVDIGESMPILLVDGDPLLETASYVADALAANSDLTGFSPEIRSPEVLRREPLDRYRAILLMNVPQIEPDGISALREYVQAGGGLAWFLGDTVQPGFYTNSLYSEEGDGLFPVPLAVSTEDLEVPEAIAPGPDLIFTSHPLFRIFEGEDNPFAASVRIDRYIPPPDDWERDDNRRADGVSTIASLRNRQPIMFEKTLGQGRIFASLSTAGPEWNNWPRNPSYVVFQLELVKRIARRTAGRDQRTVGEPIEVLVDAARYSDAVEIIAPSGGGEQITRMRATPVSEKKRTEEAADARLGEDSVVMLQAIYRETDAPGVYQVKTADLNQLTEERWLAYNMPASESRLKMIDTSSLRQLLGDDSATQIQEAGSFSWIQSQEAGQEIRRFLLIALFIMLALEQLLAWKLSFHRNSAAEAFA